MSALMIVVAVAGIMAVGLALLSCFFGNKGNDGRDEGI